MLNHYYNDLGIFLYLVPIVSAFWAMFALLVKKDRTRPQVFLAVYFATLGIGMGFSFWYDRYEAFLHNEVLRSINTALSIFCVVAVLFYFAALMNPKRLNLKYIFSHFSFAILFSVLLLVLQNIYGRDKNISEWSEMFANISRPDIFVRISAAIVLISFEIYVLIMCIKMYIQYRRFIKSRYSYEEDVDLKWIVACFAFFVCFAIADLGWIVNNTIFIKILFNVFAFFLICIIYYLGSRQDDIFIGNDNPVEDYETLFSLESKIVDKKQETQNNLKVLIEEYFEKEKPYRDSSLNLNDIATELKTNRTYLSQVINQEYQMNFYSFVNQYRIQYAISLFNDSTKQYTIDEIAELSGFKSKSVFYKQFKETTGTTPSRFKGKIER